MLSVLTQLNTKEGGAKKLDINGYELKWTTGKNAKHTIVTNDPITGGEIILGTYNTGPKVKAVWKAMIDAEEKQELIRHSDSTEPFKIFQMPDNADVLKKDE